MPLVNCRPEARNNLLQMRTGQGLPEVGDHQRYDDNSEAGFQAEWQRQHGQRHGRQSEPDGALDETGGNKSDGNQRQYFGCPHVDRK